MKIILTQLINYEDSKMTNRYLPNVKALFEHEISKYIIQNLSRFSSKKCGISFHFNKLRLT
jgi:hypothetical protein